MADRIAASQDWFSRYFAERGYVVVAIDYRHAPEWKWPEQIVDVRTALYWISQEAQKFGGDPGRIVVAGRSAGAQLAMRLAYQEGPSSIRGVVNYYGPVDLAEGWRRPPQTGSGERARHSRDLSAARRCRKPEHYKHASPITWVSKASAPTLSIYGSRDHIVEARFGRMLDAALKNAGATSVLLELPWSEHSFDAVPNGMGRRIALSYTEQVYCVGGEEIKQLVDWIGGMKSLAAYRLLLCVLVPSVCLAQLPVGTITGVVRDAAGGVLTGAQMQAISPRDTSGATTTSGEQGGFSFPALLPGEYEVHVEAVGFQRLIRSAMVEAGTTTTADMVIQIGDLNDSVTVEAAAGQIHYDALRGGADHARAN